MRVCLYHDNCFDGFGAAYAVWRRYGSRETCYQAVQYGNTPITLPDDTTELWLVDFCYRRDVLERYKQQVDRLVIIDHHKTIEKDLAGFDCDIKIFDSNYSGAYLTYRHLNGDGPEDVPLLYDYLQDRDLWRFDLPKSLEVNAYIRTIPYDFGAWVELEERLQSDFNGAVLEGAATLRLVDRSVEMMCLQTRLERIGGYDVPTVNAAAFWSETGHHMLEQNPEAPFVCMYFDRADGVRVYSLRSGEDFDCSVIAKRYGGGGHAKASGFRLPYDGNFLSYD